jgi:glycopeptide antibiotics resistance protein
MLGSGEPRTADAPNKDYAPLVSTAGVAGVFAVLGGVMALSYRRSPRHAASPLVAAVQHGVIVALLIETVQLFLASRTFDTTDILINGVATGLGAWSALAILDRGWFTPPDRPAGPALLAAALVLAQILYAVLGASVPFDLSRSHVGSAQVSWMPLAGEVRMPFLTAVGHLTSAMLAYSLLAGSVALCSWLRWGRVRWRLVAAVVCCTSVACELVQLYSQIRVTDLTQPILALLAVLVCQALACRLAPAGSALARQRA